MKVIFYEEIRENRLLFGTKMNIRAAIELLKNSVRFIAVDPEPSSCHCVRVSRHASRTAFRNNGYGEDWI
jgi:hypothetical protein